MKLVDDSVLIESYKRLHNSKKVAQELHLLYVVVTYELKRLGVLREYDSATPVVRFTDQDLINYYLECQSAKKVGQKFHLYTDVACYLLKKLGVLNKPFERYAVDDDYFSRDTPEVFYWAGFIAADGCVKLKDHRYKQIDITLAKTDMGHVAKFKAAVKFAGPINGEFNEEDTAAGVCISSDKLFDDLKRFGIVERKSLILEFPEWLASHPYVNHFIRGYNDGDGSFPKSEANTYTGRTVDQLHISFRGTNQFLSTCSKIISMNCEIEYKNPRPNSGIFTLEYGGNRQVGRIRDYLYKDSNETIWLDRKHEYSFSEKFVNLPEDFKFKPVIGTNMLTGEETWFKAMKETRPAGFRPSAVSSCCRGKYKSHRGFTWRYAEKPVWKYARTTNSFGPNPVTR
jgi:hypothetical protein